MLKFVAFILFLAFKRKKKQWQASLNVPVVGWILVSAVIALALALLVRKKRTASQSPAPRFAAPPAPVTHQKEQTATAESPPVPADNQVSSEPDDLTRINGIGPKIQQALNEEGIYTYQQLAKMDVETLQALMQRRKWTMATYTTWPEQAGLLAADRQS